jgi:hypothetical protein
MRKRIFYKSTAIGARLRSKTVEEFSQMVCSKECTCLVLIDATSNEMTVKFEKVVKGIKKTLELFTRRGQRAVFKTMNTLASEMRLFGITSFQVNLE